MNVIRAEASKFGSLLSIWILFGVTVIATWPMAITNATPLPEGISPDDPLLYSSAPVPVEYQGFEMAGFGYVLMVAAAALWAGASSPQVARCARHSSPCRDGSRCSS